MNGSRRPLQVALALALVVTASAAQAAQDVWTGVERVVAVGDVHVLIGNHEAMNLYGDLRYTSAAEFAAFRTEKSEKLREAYYKQFLVETGKPDSPAARKEFEASHPLGFVEHRQAFEPDGKYGKWIRGHNAAVRINDTIYVHGGINPKYADASVRRINETVRQELEDFARLQGGMVMDPEGPLWYRGLAQAEEATIEPQLDQFLAKNGARKIVIGHTVMPGITARLGGKVLAIDVGLSRVYGGPQAFLLMESGQLYAMNGGVRETIGAGAAATAGAGGQ